LNIGKWIGKEKEWVNPDRKNWGKYSGDNPTDYEFVGDGIKYYNNTASKKIIEKYSK